MRRSAVALVWGVAICGCLAAPVAAQPRGGGGGPGGRFGAIARLISTSVLILAIPEVRTELKINDEQNAKVDEILQSARDRIFGEVDFLELQEAEGEEREEIIQEIVALVAEVAGEAKKSLGETLDEGQLARLEELYLQSEGARALVKPEVVKTLELADEQKEKIQAILDEADNAPGLGRNFRELSEEERQKVIAEMRARREKTRADAVAVLNPQQQEAWTKMQGAEFEFPRGGGGGLGALFGRGPGGPGGGPGGNRPPGAGEGRRGRQPNESGSTP